MNRKIGLHHKSNLQWLSLQLDTQRHVRYAQRQRSEIELEIEIRSEGTNRNDWNAILLDALLIQLSEIRFSTSCNIKEKSTFK